MIRYEPTLEELPFRLSERGANDSLELLLAAATNELVQRARPVAANLRRAENLVEHRGELTSRPGALRELAVRLELWTPDKSLMLRLLGATVNVLIGRAAFSAALDLFPTTILLRQGARVVADSTEGDI